MSNTDDIGAIKQFRQRLEPHGIKIWNSSESRPEEVIQQLISREESGEEEQPRAEEIHPQGRIDVLPEDISPVKVAHFVDGSPRTVNVGFLMGMNGVSYPVALAHVGASSVAFENGRWRRTGWEDKHLILASLNKGMGLDIQFSGKWNLEDPIDKLPASRKINITDTDEMRAAAIRRARRIMKVCERELVCRLAGDCSTDWIAIDGTLFDVDLAYLGGELRNIKAIGISKSFSLNPRVMKGNKQEELGYLVEILTKLQVGWRSPVYKLTPEQNRQDKFTYMWFIRLHTARSSPMSGVIKVELPPADSFKDDVLRARTIDAISYAIFRLRNPYLYDNRRGESFLYPIYVAETQVKSGLTSVEKLTGIWRSSQY